MRRFADYSIANLTRRDGELRVSLTTVCRSCDNDGLILFDHPSEPHGSRPSESLRALLRTQPAGYWTGMPCPRCALGRLNSLEASGVDDGDVYAGVDLSGVSWCCGRTLVNTVGSDGKAVA